MWLAFIMPVSLETDLIASLSLNDSIDYRQAVSPEDEL